MSLAPMKISERAGLALRDTNGAQVFKVVGYAGLLLLAVFLCLFAGVASAILPWWFLLAAVIVPLVALFVWVWPAFGLFIALCFVFGVVPSFLGPRLELGGGSLKAGDIVLVVTFLVSWSKALLTGRRWFYLIRPYLVPLGLLSFGFVSSVVYGKLYLHNATAMAEARNFVAWLVLPTVFAMVRDESGKEWIVRGVIALSLIAAAGVIVQGLAGSQVMALGRVAALDLEHSDVTRVSAGGVTYLMAFVLYRAIARQLSGIGSAFTTFVIGGPIALALVLTFGRGVWLTSAFGALAVMFMIGGLRAATKGVVLGGIVMALALVPLVMFQPQIYDAAFDRLTGTRHEVQSGGSFGWRLKENAAAVDRIADHPLLGVGMGGEYKSFRSAVGGFDIERTYIHNGYLFFPLKMGLWAVIVPLAMIFVVLRRAWGGLQSAKIDSHHKANIAAASGASLATYAVSFTQPEWSTLSSIAAIAFLIAIIELYRSQGAEQGTATTGNRFAVAR